MSDASSSTMLAAISAELLAMTKMVETLSNIIAAHVSQSEGDARTLALIEAQTVDDLGQRLHALSQVASEVSDGADPERALDGVLLGDLADRLRAVVRGVASPVSSPSSAGDLVLFE